MPSVKQIEEDIHSIWPFNRILARYLKCSSDYNLYMVLKLTTIVYLFPLVVIPLIPFIPHHNSRFLRIIDHRLLVLLLFDFRRCCRRHRVNEWEVVVRVGSCSLLIVLLAAVTTTSKPNPVCGVHGDVYRFAIFVIDNILNISWTLTLRHFVGHPLHVLLLIEIN